MEWSTRVSSVFLDSVPVNDEVCLRSVGIVRGSATAGNPFLENLDHFDSSENNPIPLVNTTSAGSLVSTRTVTIFFTSFSSEAVKSWHGRFVSVNSITPPTYSFSWSTHSGRSRQASSIRDRRQLLSINRLWLRTRGCCGCAFDPSIHSTFRFKVTPLQLRPSFVLTPNCGPSGTMMKRVFRNRGIENKTLDI
ncbi:hypothetical protein SCHPADRAFT_74784 [Schizopora paradoxa]|uniref:Uncharacterized protein n=1 Tax=Schizopora paradoxa TaxID=27342 RepID=A0A0H2SCC0_9AGAM|nr:hypothetical protein SCHPADRAFT_74784 [Schizopora paradoxa]